MNTQNNWRLDGRVALVTGASEGIGFAIAQELIHLGAKVLIVSRSEKKLLAASLNSSVLTLAADLTSKAGQESLFLKVKELGRLDILVNNLGQADRDPFIEMNEERADRQIAINLTANLSITKSLYPFLKECRGCVVNVSSVAGQRALPARLWYGLAKAGLDFSTKALASEWGKDGIRVNAVAPWFTRTPLVASVLDNKELSEKISSITPLGRVAEPTEIAHVVAFLAMPAASYMTGSIVTIDGGFTAQGGF